MKRFLFILPVALPKEVLGNFAIQIPEHIRRNDISIDFIGTKNGASLMDSPYESTLADAMVLDAGAKAEADGYDAVCSFSMSDSGVSALRSRLSIPVVGACQASLAMGLQLGKKMSVITMWAPWAHHAQENAEKYGLKDRVASVRHIDTRPDTHELLSGKEDFVFKKLEDQAVAAIKEDHADVIILGSTTMYQSHQHLTQHLPCPVISPGMAAYKTCEMLVDMKLTASKIAYPTPGTLNDDVFSSVTKLF